MIDFQHQLILEQFDFYQKSNCWVLHKP